MDNFEYSAQTTDSRTEAQILKFGIRALVQHTYQPLTFSAKDMLVFLLGGSCA